MWRKEGKGEEEGVFFHKQIESQFHTAFSVGFQRYLHLKHVF